jgi:hypothetical protein
MEDKLDQYLREANRELKNPRSKRQADRKPKARRETGLRRWATSASMDLFKFYMPVIMLAIGGGIFLIVETSIATYCFYALGIVLIAGIIFCAVDFYHYENWTGKINYKLDGWSSITHSRSRQYWDFNGEYWLPVKIVVVLKEPVNEKQFRVVEAFLKKLRKRLNRWTVSKETHMGYSQPNGWAHDGVVIAGEMNPRILNLIRKRFSGELNRLSKLMPGAIDKVIISQTGKEQYHRVYVDPSD